MKFYRKFEIEIEALTEGEGLLCFCIGFSFLFSLQPFATFAQVWITITGLKRDRTGEPQRYFLSADLEGFP